MSYSSGAAHQLIRSPVSPCAADGFPGQFADAFTLDLLQSHRHTHENPDQSSDFYRRIPTLNVVAGISFGNPNVLRFGERLIKAESFLHAAENDVGGRVKNAVKSMQMNCGQVVAKQSKDWNAIHHSGLKEKSSPLRDGEGTQRLVRVHNGSLVGGDGMCSHFERRADMLDGRLAVTGAQRCCFEQHVGLCQTQPVADIVCAGLPVRPRHFFREAITHSLDIESVGIGNPAQPPCGYTSDPPFNAPFSQLETLSLEQTTQCPVDVAQPKHTKIVSANNLSPRTTEAKLPRDRHRR